MKNFDRQFVVYLKKFYPTINVGTMLIAATSLFYYFTISMNKMMEANFDPRLAAVLGGVIGLVGIKFSDGRMMYTLQFAFKSLLSMLTKDFWASTQGLTRQTLLGISAILVCSIGLGRLYVSSMVSYWTKDDISAQIIKQPKQTQSNLVLLSNKKEDNRMTILSSMKEQITTAKTSETKRIAAATTPLWEKWTKLYNTQGKSNKSDYKARSNYLFNSVDKQPKKFKKVIAWRNELLALEAQIEAAEAKEKASVGNLEEQQQQLLLGSAPDPTLAALSTALVSEVKVYDTRLGNMANFMAYAIQFVALLLTVYGFLLGVGCVLTGEDVINVEESADLSFTNFIMQLVKQKGGSATAWLAAMCRVDMHPELALSNVGGSSSLEESAQDTDQSSGSQSSNGGGSRSDRKWTDKSKLESDIRKYYPRCFQKDERGATGSKDSLIRERNRRKVKAWVQLLKDIDIEATVDLIEFRPAAITFKELEV